MNKDRLLKLADFLENKVNPKRFQVTWWAEKGWPKDKKTKANAFGWATLIFRKEGYMLYDDDPRQLSHEDPWYTFGSCGSYIARSEISAQGYGIVYFDAEFPVCFKGIGAVRRFFDLTFDEIEEISNKKTYDSEKPTLKDTVEKIRKMIYSPEVY